MTELAIRPWVPSRSEQLVQRVAEETASCTTQEADRRISALIRDNQRIHEHQSVNLNPAANAMNPRAEAVLSARLGSRPSLGYPGDKYEMGLEAVEEIEIIAAELAAEVFRAPFAEIRVPSGAIANLYTFMACCEPGDSIIVPPASIGGHVTHHLAGAAGLYGLDIHEAPIDADRYTIDTVGLAGLAERVRPKVVTIGASLNLHHHPVAAIRQIADNVGAKVLFDAAHLSGLIAGGAWPNPLAAGAHVMTMSTYKSLGGPPSGLLVTNDASIAERVDGIAYPGLTANFDAAKSAALAITLLDWKDVGPAYAAEMVETASALVGHLIDEGVAVYGGRKATKSHAFALDANAFGGGHACAQLLREANLLTSGIGLPIESEPGTMPGLRIGTNEIVRWGMTVNDMAELAGLIAAALRDPKDTASQVTEFRSRFTEIHFVRNDHATTS